MYEAERFKLGGVYMYQNYIFDLYGTLVDIQTNEKKGYLWEKVAEFYGFYKAMYTPKELKAAYIAACKKAEEEIKDVTYPEIKLEDIFYQLFTDKGIMIEKPLAIAVGQMFRIISTRYIQLYPGVIDFLENLKKKGKKVYLLSNAQAIFTKYEMDYLGITKYFDGIVISSDEGCAKPDAKFYQCILETYQLDPQKSIMIGNDPITDIKGSYEIGLDSLYIHSNLSPGETGNLLSKYTIMDGDFTKVKDLILK